MKSEKPYLSDVYSSSIKFKLRLLQDFINSEECLPSFFPQSELLNDADIQMLTALLEHHAIRTSEKVVL